MANRIRKRWAGGVAALLLLLGAAGAFQYRSLPNVGVLATTNPRSTALIDARAGEAKAKGHKARRRQLWTSLASIAPMAVDAVLVSEDVRFFKHQGVDTEELQAAAHDAWKKGGLGRGASTLTQQLAKNLWLSEDRSILRKARELFLAWRLEKTLTKERILTLYLNVVEWGDGVYGIGAAAQEHFGVPASDLSPAQSAILAAMLPAPRKRTPASHSPALLSRALWIIDRLQEFKKLTPVAADAARKEIQSTLGPSRGSEEEPEVPPPAGP